MNDLALRPEAGSTGTFRRHRARLAVVQSRAQLGVEAPPVTIEVFLSGGLPAFSIVGLPETAVRESKDRVRGAILSSDFDFPDGRITVSLGPADMRKSGGRFDLAIALGILAAARQIPQDEFGSHEFYGELGLNGDLRAIPGALPAALKAAEAGNGIFVPADNGAEAALSTACVFVANSLLEVTAHLTGQRKLAPLLNGPPPIAAVRAPNLAEVRGQALAKRALEIAAAGEHNLLLLYADYQD